MKHLIFVLPLLLAACSTVPENIQTPPQYDLQLENVAGHVDEHMGHFVRWGGEIVEVTNNENQTAVQIVQFPLNHYGRPKPDKMSQGRFIGISEQFLDPVVYQVGKTITFTGVVNDEQTTKVDKKTLILPVIDVTSSHLWPLRKPTQNYRHFGHYYPYYYYNHARFRHHSLFYPRYYW